MKKIVNGNKVVGAFASKDLIDDMKQEREITGETPSEYLRTAIRNEGIRRKKMRLDDDYLKLVDSNADQ